MWVPVTIMLKSSKHGQDGRHLSSFKIVPRDPSFEGHQFQAYRRMAAGVLYVRILDILKFSVGIPTTNSVDSKTSLARLNPRNIHLPNLPTDGFCRSWT